MPSAPMPIANTRPPWCTITSANTIAGTAPEAAPPLRVLVERRLERLAREVRPELVAEDELRVRELPQQVVRDAQLAARADQEVGIVHVGRVEVAAEVFLRLTGEGSRRVHDLRPAAVVEGHEQGDAVVRRGELLGPVHSPSELGVEALAAADESHPHPLVVELRRL